MTHVLLFKRGWLGIASVLLTFIWASGGDKLPLFLWENSPALGWQFSLFQHFDQKLLSYSLLACKVPAESPLAMDLLDGKCWLSLPAFKILFVFRRSYYVLVQTSLRLSFLYPDVHFPSLIWGVGWHYFFWEISACFSQSTDLSNLLKSQSIIIYKVHGQGVLHR